MLTLQVRGLGRLRSSILSLLAVGQFADLKYSPTSMSLTVSKSEDESDRFVAALQMFTPFFTISSDGDRNFLSRIYLNDLFRLILVDDHYFTILIPDDLTFANLIFATRAGDLQSLSLLRMLPPQNEEVIQFVYEGFVAIDAAEFRKIVSDFSKHTNPICVTATTSEVTFSVTTRNNRYAIVLTAKERKCLAGGLPEANGVIQFSIALNHENFFNRASRMTKLVWLFLSADWKTTVICFTGEWANILACYYPPHRMKTSPLRYRYKI